MRQDIGLATSYAPESTDVLHAAACLAFIENRYSDAVSISGIVIKRNRNLAASYELSGEALLKLGRLAEAADVLEQGLALNPISPYMLNLLADVKLRLGDFDRAFELAQSNYQWNPDNAHAMDMMGYIHWNQGDYVKAHEIYTEAKAANPTDSYITDALIMIYAELGLTEKAESIATTRTAKAFAYAVTGQHKEAAALLNDPLDPIQDGEVAYIIGDIARAAALMEQQVIDETMLSMKPISYGNGDLYAEACFIFSKQKHDYAGPICEKTASFYTGAKPDTFLRSSDINGGVIWHMTQGNQDAAMAWLEELNRRGVYDQFFLEDPALVGIKDHPRFDAFYQTMMRGMAEQRTRVEAQL